MEIKEKNKQTASGRIRARASTQSILGPRNSKQPEISLKWNKHYEDLKALRDQILEKKEMLAKDANASVESPLFGEHMADAATDSYDRDWALTMLSSEQNALYEIEEALDRLARGTYGICELTGNPIEPGRLRAIPWTRFCAAAQMELEAKGPFGRTQFGALGGLYDSEEPDEAVEEEAEAAQPKEAK